jgi:hypothetical protein
VWAKTYNRQKLGRHGLPSLTGSELEKDDLENKTMEKLLDNINSTDFKSLKVCPMHLVTVK